MFIQDDQVTYWELNKSVKSKLKLKNLINLILRGKDQWMIYSSAQSHEKRLLGVHFNFHKLEPVLTSSEQLAD